MYGILHLEVVRVCYSQKPIISRASATLFRERSKIISLKFCLLWTPRPPVSLNYHFRVNPSPQKLSLFITLVALCFDTFYAFIAFLVLFLHNSWLFGVISLIVQSPRPPISLNYHSRSQPPAPSQWVIWYLKAPFGHKHILMALGIAEGPSF